ncbi:putative transporter C11D3.18C [Daldinia childiae]|uniref:putative transporter C11D3.18C n=1 Tax=Daldinia childiae TaxID=326645 RepID=UPI001448842D|nr:putative transporter C11D3.18C [Daldinia childiae]KAF3058092.1 putative transporter C11D3.18C [Daldinia childiae]
MSVHRESEDLPAKPELDSQAQQVETATLAEDAEFKKREARVVAKLDLYVCPILVILQLISFLDRGNIGFAATQGMTTDLNLVGTQLNTAVSLFYPLYILSEFPAALIVKRVGFNRVIPAAAACWGLCCLGNGFARNFGDLITCRLLMGMFEGFLMPSLTLMLANWYKRDEIGLRISYLFIASAISSAFSGLIAYGILFMNGAAGYPGWRWVSPEEATFFDWLKTRPENAKHFNVFMGSHRTGVRTWLDRPEIINEITDAFKKVTARGEVAKRKGYLSLISVAVLAISAFKKRVPNLKGTIILEDLEEVVANAELEPGIEKLGVNFLEGQPVKGAASYYFRSVLRNWPDRYSRSILGYARDAMDKDSLLLIDEIVLPDRGAHRYETQLDLTMLAMLNAEARTETHWKQLLAEVGMEVKDIVFYEEETREGIIIAKKVAT